MIIYSSEIKKDDLLKFNISIGDNVKMGRNVKLNYGCCIDGDSIIGDDCEISSNSVITNSSLGKGVKVVSSFIDDSFVGDFTTVGPFATVKKNSRIGKDCRVGNFVEVKNSIIGDETKIAHLSYVGDADLGKMCNVGCGVVFCNYNGYLKQRSQVGDCVFIGSNVNVVAPVKIGDFAYIAAGSTINKDVEANEFSIARSRQENKNNFENLYLKNKKFTKKQ